MTVRRPNQTVKAKDEAIDFIEERAPLWQERMGLGHFEIAHFYVDAGSDMMLGTRPKNRPGTVRCAFGANAELSYTACVETRWNYQLADVYFFMPSVLTWSRRRLDHIIVHEYSHIMAATEQYLLDLKLEEAAASEEMTTFDFDVMATLYYERMEMATENIARAVYAGWERDDETLVDPLNRR